MKSIKRINSLIIAGLLLQFSIGLAVDHYALLLNPARRGDLEQVKTALGDPQIDIDYHANYRATALIEAARCGQVEIVALLLKAGANPNILDKSDWQWAELSVDLDACKEGYTALMGAAEGGHIEVVKLLLEYGADPNIQTTIGDTALILAAEKNYSDIVRMLLRSGADPNLKSYTRTKVPEGRPRSKNDWTALMRSACNGHIETVRLLLEYGADPYISSTKGNTALKLATGKGHQEIIKLIKQRMTFLESLKRKIGWRSIKQALFF